VTAASRVPFLQSSPNKFGRVNSQQQERGWGASQEGRRVFGERLGMSPSPGAPGRLGRDVRRGATPRSWHPDGSRSTDLRSHVNILCAQREPQQEPRPLTPIVPYTR
jgi:hypothetical protein